MNFNLRAAMKQTLSIEMMFIFIENKIDFEICLNKSLKIKKIYKILI